MKKVLEITDYSKKLHSNIWKWQDFLVVFNDEESVSRNFELEIDVLWDNAKLHLRWRVLSEMKNNKIFSIKINVLWENQKVELDLKWIVSWEWLLDFDWSWIIWNESKWVDIQISERILLFWKKAKAKALPVLRVESDKLWNVSHSAIIAPIDKEQLFYLETRGVNEEEAIGLIKKGFLR